MEVNLKVDDQGQGAFYIMDDAEQLGEMVVNISDKALTIYHTEVSNKAQGKGLAKKMMNTMIDYARKNHFKVIPLCTYVHAQFKHHPDEYADIWNKE